MINNLISNRRLSYVYGDGKFTKIPKQDFIFARVKTGQTGTLSLVE